MTNPSTVPVPAAAQAMRAHHTLTIPVSARAGARTKPGAK